MSIMQQSIRLQPQPHSLQISHQSELIRLRNELRELKQLMAKVNMPTSVSESGPQMIAIPIGCDLERFDQNEILYLKAEGNYTSLVTADGKKFTLSKTLKHVHALFQSNQMIRCHQSYSVNSMHVQTMTNNNGLQLILHNGTIIPVSRRKKAEVKQLLGQLV